jgi:S-adenosylmethionine decarboxylase proenzyme
MYLGNHIVVDMFDINIDILTKINSNQDNINEWNECVKKWLIEANITLLNTSWHSFNDKGAFTVLYLLSESHLSIHTWPEHKYIALDVFTCGDANTQLLVNNIRDYFDPKKTTVHQLNRGEIAVCSNTISSKNDTDL